MLQRVYFPKEFQRYSEKSDPPITTAVSMPQGFWDFLSCVFIPFGTTWVGISWPRFLRKKSMKRLEMFWIFCAVFPNTNRQSNLKPGRCCLRDRKDTGQVRLQLPNLRVERKVPRKSMKNYRMLV